MPTTYVYDELIEDADQAVQTACELLPWLPGCSDPEPVQTGPGMVAVPTDWFIERPWMVADAGVSEEAWEFSKGVAKGVVTVVAVGAIGRLTGWF